MLKRKWYTDLVDTWALGCICYELMAGVTPFHCSNMQDLVKKINDGRYKVSVGQDRPISIETCIFLLECLQTVEEMRMPIEELATTPFISAEFADFPLHDLDKKAFESKQE